MRILLVNSGPWGTGSATVLEAVMKELKKKGHQVMAFFPDLLSKNSTDSPDNQNPEDYKIISFPAEYEGVHFYTFPLIIPDPNPRNHQNAWTYKDLSEQELQAFIGLIKDRLQRVITEFKPDIIECQHIWINSYVCQLLEVPYVCVAHHSDQLGYAYDQRMQSYAKEAAQKAEYIFAISDYVKQHATQIYEVNEDKVVFLANGYDQNIFYPNKEDETTFLEQFNIKNPKNLPIVSFCGKISMTKGIDVLLEANYYAQKEEEYLLLLVGSGNIEDVEFDDKKKYSYKNVHFLGHRTYQELAMLHNISRFSTLPSRSEGFGIAALEAMGCAKPLVATNVGGLVDFAVGELVNPENPAELSKAMIRMLRLPEQEYQKLCVEAYKSARKYSWEDAVKKRLIYYKKILKKNTKNTTSDS